MNRAVHIAAFLFCAKRQKKAYRTVQHQGLLFVLCFLLGLFSFSQNFPVQVLPQSIPPAPIYVANYADPSTSNAPLRVQIILNDFEIANRQIRLKTYFSGRGLSFQSNDVVVGAPPLFLEGGIPLVLSNVELAPYFQYNNITGINANQYGRAIPEGTYEFCVEVYDVLTGRRLSDKSCAFSVVFQNEPPFLVLPRNQTNVLETNPQNLIFQWTPRSINVSNVEYELSLVEIWDTQVDPQQAFLSSPPVFRTTTSATTYLYGPSDPLLLSGKNYAWRVQAKAKQGTEEIGLFKNQGYSQIFSFSYAGDCQLPLSIQHQVKGSTNATVFWEDFSTDIPEFTLRYRQKNVSDAAWFLAKTTTNELTIWNLKAGTTYEYQLRKNCGITETDWSFTKEFTTALEFEEESVLDCGVAPDINLTNKEPLANIGNGATFKAGDFPVKILEVSGSNGRFTGKGYVTIPYLSSIKVAVAFTNVLINTDYQLAEGSVRTAYDADWGAILDTGDVVDVVDDVGDVFTGGDNVDYQIDFEINSVNDIKIENGEIIITGPNGVTKTLDHDDGDTYQIKDASGDTYTIDEDGNITKGAEAAEGGEATAQNTDGISGGSGTADAPSVSNITANGVAVTFKKSANTKYDLDIADSDFEKSKYPKAKLANGTDYYPIHKAVVDGQTDEFLAEISISNSNISIDDLIVKTVSGSKIDTRKDGNSNLIISLKGVNSYRSEEAIITYKDENDKYKIAASFFIHHIKQQELVNVVIVSVNGTAQLANLEQELNGIFGKAGAQFKVSTDSFSLQATDWDDNNNGKLDYDGSGLLSDYPQELKNIQQKYKQNNPNWDAKAYHLFLLPNDISLTKSLSGFMPKTRQWGYIFNAHKDDALENKSSQNLVAVHELGHGVFKLAHPFQDDENKSGGGTNWLMDYNNGDQLPYAHWAAMSDESLQLFLFQDEEDGEISSSNKPMKIEIVKNLVNNIRSNYYLLQFDGLEWRNKVEDRCRTIKDNRSENCSLITFGNYDIDVGGGQNLSFRVKGEPSTSLERFVTKKDVEELLFKKRKFFWLGETYDIVYQLKINDGQGNYFLLEFDHHNDIEAFCKYVGIVGSLNEKLVAEVEVMNREQTKQAYGLSNSQNVDQFIQNLIEEVPVINLEEVVIVGGFTNISKNIVYYLNTNYLPSLSTIPECNSVDVYFAEIPTYALHQLNPNELWNALKSLLKCTTNENYTNEEHAILTIIKGIGNKSADDLLNGLIQNKMENQSLLHLLFKKMDDWGGDDNFTATVLTLYDFWKTSSYAQQQAEIISYESDKSLVFYTSNYNLVFNEDCSKVNVSYSKNSYVGNTYHMLGSYTIESVKVGEYHSYQPMLMTNAKKMVTAFEQGTLPSSPIVPMFLLKAIEVKNFSSNVEQGTYMAVDIGLTFTGIGNVTKLMHLKTLSNLQKIQVVIGAVEFSSGATGLALEYTGCNTEFCKKMRTYLFVIEVASLGSDVLLGKAIKKSADDALEAAKKADNVPKEVIDELEEASRKFGDENGIGNLSDNLANTVGKQLDFSPSWLPNRTITGNLDNPKGLLGVYNRQLPDGTWVSDTKNALDNIGDFPVANTSNFKTVSKDGYKMLNTPQEFYQNADQFWTQYNKPWLDDLVSKKADIVILSDKSNDYLKYKWTKNSNTGQIEFDVIPGTSTRIKTGFGSEIEYMENLVQQGLYQWDAINGVYKAL